MRALITCSILILTLGSSIGQNRETQVNWLTFEQLDDSLQAKPKPVFVFFHTDWCSYCRKMLTESLRDTTVVEKLNREYYAVQFDAETMDTVRFDNMAFTNTGSRKRAGQYHQLAKILLGPEQDPVFPTTILFHSDFTVRQKTFNYLSIRQLINIL